ncbi:IclR family transcriptional regulator [Bradyrhizobium sp. WSM2254]|uniref:IclR family transcriptional regulator n=1 Tax=Bradyrhizobium sp. WSM2254 TaxID=1188263 RepID=UPI00067641FB|nr:helix-turn-helix domain-containing protein [Bradyrhizobium sp. WSM2254]
MLNQHRALVTGATQGTIEVVSRSFEVLRCFNGLDVRLGNGDLSTRCGLPKSTVSRLTQTLTRMGLLVYLSDEKQYRIGPSAICMSLAATRNPNREEHIHSILNDVVAKVPGTITLGIPDRLDIVIIEAATVASPLHLKAQRGDRFPITRTAAGHAYAAVIDPDLADDLLLQIVRNAPNEAERLQSGLEQNRLALRECGYVIGRGLFRTHYNAIAVPFWCSLYNSYLVLSMTVLATDYDKQRLRDEIAPLMIRSTAEVERLLDGLEPKATTRSNVQVAIMSHDRRK